MARNLILKAVDHEITRIGASQISENAKNLAIINLGLCCNPCTDYHSTQLDSGLTSVYMCGNCLHAYGMSRAVANKLWSLLLKDHDSGCQNSARGLEFPPDYRPEFSYMDWLLNTELCKRTEKGYLLVGKNLVGEHFGHVGMVQQDRTKFPSIISDKSKGVDGG